MCSCLSNHRSTSNVITDSQYVFRPQKSTDMVIDLLDKVNAEPDNNNNYVPLLFFDRGQSKLLVRKIQKIIFKTQEAGGKYQGCFVRLLYTWVLFRGWQ